MPTIEFERDVQKVDAGLHSAGDGLYLRVTDTGSRSWVYRFALNGRTRDMGLGSAKVFKLAEAKELAAEARKLKAKGIDPLGAREEKQAEAKAAAARVGKTFKVCSLEYLSTHRATWSPKHVTQWEGSLATYVFPSIGTSPIDKIDTDDVLKVIRPIWSTMNVTAQRVRGRIELVLASAIAQGLRGDDRFNPAQWKGHLDHILPKPKKVAKVQHFAALPLAEIGAFMAKLRAREGVWARALEFTILTAARSDQTYSATWGEIDLDNALWSISAERMKADRPHKVPLSARAVEILRERRAEQPDGARVFLGPHVGKGQQVGMGRTLKYLGYAPAVATVHGFRSTFRTWGGQRTSFPRELLEEALAHVVGDATERAYWRDDMHERRRPLMGAWAEFCANPAATAKVLPMVRAAE
jgi:integrase